MLEACLLEFYLQMIQHDVYICKDGQDMCEKINNDSENNVFTPRNKCVKDLNKNIPNPNIEHVSVVKFLGVMIDTLLSWKCHWVRV